MKPLAFASAALLLAVSGPVHAAQSPAAAPSFGETMEVDVVNVDVTVTDRKGNRVTGLQKEDFEVLDDGQRVEITNFDARTGAGERETARGRGTAEAAPAVRSPEEAWSLVVFVDDLNITPAHRAHALRQLREFLAREIRPGDRVMLASYDLGLRVRVPFTSDLAALGRGLDALSAVASRGDESRRDRQQAIDAMLSIQKDSLSDPTDPVPCPQNIVTPAQAYASSRRQEVLGSLSSLTVLVNSLSGVPGRKAVLHVSDGIPITPGEEVFQFLSEICGGHGTTGFGASTDLHNTSVRRPSGLGDKPTDADSDPQQVFDSASLKPQSYRGDSQALLDAQAYSVARNLETLAAHANAHRVTLYTLQASGLQGTAATDAGFGPGERMQQFPSVGTALRAGLRDSLQLLADQTGGRSILDANQLLPDLDRMRDDLTTSYSLGFSPAHSGDGREHKLVVKVKRPDLQLRYRQSYRDKPVLERSVDRTLAALFYGIEDNPLDATVSIGEQIPAEGGQYAVPIQLRIPLFKLAILNQDATYEGKLRLLVALRDDEGGVSAVRQVEVPLHIPRKEVLNAMGQYYVYTLTLKMKPGVQHVAVAVRDDVAATTSYLSRTVTAGPPTAAAVSHP